MRSVAPQSQVDRLIIGSRRFIKKKRLAWLGAQRQKRCHGLPTMRSDFKDEVVVLMRFCLSAGSLLVAPARYVRKISLY